MFNKIILVFKRVFTQEFIDLCEYDVKKKIESIIENQNENEKITDSKLRMISTQLDRYYEGKDLGVNEKYVINIVNGNLKPMNNRVKLLERENEELKKIVLQLDEKYLDIEKQNKELRILIQSLHEENKNND